MIADSGYDHEAEAPFPAAPAKAVQQSDSDSGRGFTQHLLSLPEPIDVERDPTPLRDVDWSCRAMDNQSEGSSMTVFR